MRLLCFIGSAVFIFFAVKAFFELQNSELGSLFAYSAILGILGEMGRRKPILSGLGFLVSVFMLTNLFFIQNDNSNHDLANIYLLGNILTIIWMLALTVIWLKRNKTTRSQLNPNRF